MGVEVSAIPRSCRSLVARPASEACKEIFAKLSLQSYRRSHARRRDPAGSRGPGHRRPGTARTGPSPAQPAARAAPPERPRHRKPARARRGREQRFDELPPASARGLRLRRGGRGPGDGAGALVAGPAPADQLARRRDRRAGGRCGGRGRAHPHPDRRPWPGAAGLAGAAHRAGAGLDGGGLAQRPRAAAATRPGAHPGRRAQRRSRPLDGRAPQRRAGRGDRARGALHRRGAAQGVAVMGAPTTVRSATRRLVGLTALRWLPVGLTTPITVLLAQARGLTLGEIGLLFTVHGIVVLVLELPTGGLADVLGRRPVVVAGAALHLGSCLLCATATTFAGFLAGIVALGLGRVLDSGPLEAWYVDTVHRIDPAADVAPGLSQHGAADGGSLAVGAVLGGFLPALLGGAGAAGLALPYLGAAALDVVYILFVVRLLTEHRPPREGSVRVALASGARAVPGTV